MFIANLGVLITILTNLLIIKNLKFNFNFTVLLMYKLLLSFPEFICMD